jgi:ABC-type lipoprotein release transport system permease subunit
MPFSLLVAWRYITANSLQTLLLVLGVSLSVVVFVFITALINGLSIFLTQETTSKIAHI